MNVFGLTPLQITFPAVLLVGLALVITGIYMGLRAKVDALVEAQAEAERARAKMFDALATSGATTLAQISSAMQSLADGLRSLERGADMLERSSIRFAEALTVALAANAEPSNAVHAGRLSADTSPRMVSGDELEPARAQALEAEVISQSAKLMTDAVKGTVGQIPKLERGAQFAALGVILMVVAVGVGMFVYAVHPAG